MKKAQFMPIKRYSMGEAKRKTYAAAFKVKVGL